MAFEIKIKPLLLFDLEERIVHEENVMAGAGKRFYDSFLNSLSELQSLANARFPIYETVQKFVVAPMACTLFYIVDNETIFVMGMS